MHFFSQFWNERLHYTLPRKNPIHSQKTLIYGPPRSGKTSLALDYVQNLELPQKAIIYFDLNDARIQHNIIKQELLKLHLERKIQCLIIDHFHPSFTFPNIPITLLISQENIALPSFDSLFCPSLSFLEYASFYPKSSSTQTLLKNFIKDGNLPQIATTSEHQKLQIKQEILKLALLDDFTLLEKLIPFQSQKITIFQFYTILKKTNKISKDKVYFFFENLQRKNMIFFIPHLHPNKPKKLYFYDFSIPKSLSINPTIIPILENMFVLELRSITQEIYYDDFGCFVVPQFGRFLFVPFAQKESIEDKLSKLSHQGLKDPIKIITLDYSDSGEIHKIAWEALSFIEFALGGIE
ncbi:AAA family ATPase [Helicobacter kayseriensis]|uniref:AAA family ATPase n=1 Tax=Helicobacter kayseriensis TaxID=2905877 RepID=UPI001E336074|nr:AAA family ATPase [Helicobacter kayseriensis]MCE3047296.1 AAA family ATPase [Helicobacter kayseriensis]MCE3048667.1 AAA family ATPase [Helicobacter kayseriensis]